MRFEKIRTSAKCTIGRERRCGDGRLLSVTEKVCQTCQWRARSFEDQCSPHFKRSSDAPIPSSHPACTVRWGLRRSGEAVRSAGLRARQTFTPLDYCLWGDLKHRVYATQPGTLDELRQRISEETKKITAETRNKTLLDFPRRLQTCLKNESDHIEWPMTTFSCLTSLSSYLLIFNNLWSVLWKKNPFLIFKNDKKWLNLNLL